MSNENNETGYKKPPKSTQFKKGQSGNPSGRPKKPKVVDFITSFEKVFMSENEKRVNGKLTNISNMEVILNILAQQAAKPENFKERAELFKLVDKFQIEDRFLDFGSGMEDFLKSSPKPEDG